MHKTECETALLCPYILHVKGGKLALNARVSDFCVLFLTPLRSSVLVERVWCRGDRCVCVCVLLFRKCEKVKCFGNDAAIRPIVHAYLLTLFYLP